MRVDFYIARHLQVGGSDRLQSRMSMRFPTIGVALSVAIMIVTIAVIGGFRREVQRMVTGFDAQLTITPYDIPDYDTDVTADATTLRLTPAMQRTIAEAIPGAAIDACVVRPAILKTPEAFSAVVFRGYDEGHDWQFVESNIVYGSLDDFLSDDTANSIVISENVARGLRLAVGDKINTCFLVDNRMRLRNFTVAAIFATNFADYDKTVAYASPRVLRRIGNLDADQATRIELTGLSDDAIDGAHAALVRALSDACVANRIEGSYAVDNIHISGAQYYNWLALLDTNVVVIISIMGLISVFTLIASLFIIILERVRTIAILKTVGATNALVRRIFILLASKIIIRGLIIGNVIALAIIVLQHWLHIIKLDPEAYFLSYVPTYITPLQIVALDVAALIVGMAVMIIPSMVVSGMSPSRTVRFE